MNMRKERALIRNGLALFYSPAQVITNTINTEGIKGKGIALEYKKRFPKIYEAYKKKCVCGEFTVGNLTRM